MEKQVCHFLLVVTDVERIVHQQRYRNLDEQDDDNANQNVQQNAQVVYLQQFRFVSFAYGDRQVALRGDGHGTVDERQHGNHSGNEIEKSIVFVAQRMKYQRNGEQGDSHADDYLHVQDDAVEYDSMVGFHLFCIFQLYSRRSA